MLSAGRKWLAVRALLYVQPTYVSQQEVTIDMDQIN